ncbi:MAG: flagellar assembly peptidoglycan hydrolase FlgJ [Thiobacillus sp.]|nr:flagellar assembly peptidoglycan hydrolase FlgJ [Thiobacillus sp.]
MSINTDISSGLAIDAKSLDKLKLGAAQSSPEALKAAAQQFEAVFMNMLMKSMREATPKEGMFDNEQTRMYTSMLDQQLTQRLASRGIGLADVMVRQLSPTAQQPAGEMANTGMASGLPLKVNAAPGFKPVTAPDVPAEAALRLNALAAQAYVQAAPAQPATPPVSAVPVSVPVAAPRKGDAPAHVESFVQRLLPHAQAASASSGIPAHFMMGQAALETGWGRAEIRGADGQNSHNLFGIKAGGSWTGRTVDIVTTEYVNGKPQKQVDTFRAYDSYADSFRDYASLLQGNARYQNVVAAGHSAAGFAQGLQQAGYATDPKYAQKLMSVIRLVETS